MRLINYINESSNIDTLLKDTEIWWKYCYQKKVKNKFLWRGTRHRINDFKKMITRTDREPTDTCREMHDLLDDIFYEKFDVHARSATVFCFSSIEGAKHYGDYRNIIIPVGDFNYIWSPKIRDLYSHIENEDFYNIICYGYEDLSKYEYSYEEDYGEESGNGTWYYNGKDTGESDYDTAKEEVIGNFFDPDLDLEEAENQFDEFLMKWEPQIDFNDYVDEITSTEKEESVSEVKNIINNNYIMNKGFKKLMDNINSKKIEVMLDCDKYYEINKDWAEKYLIPIMK